MKWLVCLMLAAPPTAQAADQLSVDHPGFLQKGTTMVPFRAIFEWLGATVNYDHGVITAARSRGEKTTTVRLTAGAAKVAVNEASSTMPQQVTVRSGVSYVPLRFVGEAMGASVTWDAKQSRALLADGSRQGWVKVTRPAPPLAPSLEATMRAFTVAVRNVEKRALRQFVDDDGFDLVQYTSGDMKHFRRLQPQRVGADELVMTFTNELDPPNPWYDSLAEFRLVKPARYVHKEIATAFYVAWRRSGSRWVIDELGIYVP